MSNKSTTQAQVSGSIANLINYAQKNEKRHRLRGGRHAFFRSVSLRTSDGRPHAAFSREISRFGVGLLHDIKLVPGEVECRISCPDGPPTIVPLNIIWCEPCGDGWYISGGEFVGV